ncbi:A-kinase anchor protein 14 [Sphaeramia orbicularis]|uniref:Uncharacterized protein n=1 Tax=Sphaeramia orbicularis TaxID=375764 RepID=A0A673BWA6_9TELE|nr:A-kinase anchor protein 14 [Sphaeramia orbicularis]
MENDQTSSSGLNLSAESTLLVKTLLEKHHRAKKQDDTNTEMRNTNWVTGENFTVEVGKMQIEEYIQTWELQPCWLHSLVFLCSVDEEHHTFHLYRARFSTPTPRKPIQGTASVYFAVDKVKPHTLPVEVYYIVESNRLMHAAGRTRFREKWLADVIESKSLLQREMDLWTNEVAPETS